MIPIGKRIIEIGIAFALIYTAVVWIVFAFLPGLGDLERIRSALWWWFPGVFLVVGVATLLTQLGERRARLAFGMVTIYGAVLVYVSIGAGDQFLNLFFGFIVGGLLITGLVLLLIRPSSIMCPHCSIANPEKHEFCFKCGNRLRP